MLKCWEDTPDKRPSFTELKTKFAEMLQKNNPYIQLDNINMQKSYYNPQPPEDSTTGSRKQSEERLNDSECAPSISSSSSSSSDSAPLEASNLQLLSCTNAGIHFYILDCPILTEYLTWDGKGTNIRTVSKTSGTLLRICNYTHTNTPAV